MRDVRKDTKEFMMKPLVFNKPHFNKGINLAVRRGHKWHGLSGQCVELEDTDGNNYGTALITATQLRRFDEIDELELSLEHDPECRKWVNLLDAMIQNYEEFSQQETVTLIWFDPN